MADDEQSIRDLIARLNEIENGAGAHGVDATIAGIDAVLSDDWMGSNNGAPIHDRIEERTSERALFTAFPDYHRSIDQLIVDPPFVAFQWTMTGTNTGPFRTLPPSGRPLKVSGMSWGEVRDGRIWRSFVFLDTQTFLAQLTGRGP